MKIATWNIERLKHRKSLDKIVDKCINVKADILVLTESDESIELDYEYCYHTPTPPPLKIEGYDTPMKYKESEHRVSIYTNYKIVDEHPTFNKYAALCLELETEKGNILVYGTIMGILGNRRSSYQKDLEEQCKDICKFVDEGYNICICGDYNCSFSDNYYFTKEGRQLIEDTFEKCDIELLTRESKECIDHIALSNKLIDNQRFKPNEWNHEKKLSDHKGICIEFD